MKKTLILAVIPALAIANAANASCSEGLTEKVWDKTAAGYCKIFFPNCTEEKLGKRLSYSRDVNPEVICVGEKGEYSEFYKVTIQEANGVFGTDFAKMGVNYTDELSKWLFDNCTQHCGVKEAVKEKLEHAKEDLKAAAKEVKAEVKEEIKEEVTEAKEKISEIKAEVKEEVAEAKTKIKELKSESKDAE